MQSTVILLGFLVLLAQPPRKAAPAGDPPKDRPTADARKGPNRSDWQSDVANDPRAFKSLRDMDDAEKKEMRQRRWHIFRLNKEARKSFQCKRCKGTGRIYAVVSEGGKQRAGVAGEAPVPCPACGGTAQSATPQVFTKLDEFFARRDVYERCYPFEEKIRLGTESFVLSKAKGIGNAWFNLDFHLRERLGRLAEGDTVIVSVDLLPVEKRDRKKGKLYGYILLDSKEFRTSEFLIEADQEIPPNINGWSELLVLATYQGKAKLPDDDHGHKRFLYVLKPRLIEKL